MFEVTAEQEDLRATVRRFLAETSDEAEVRRLAATASGYDPSAWRRMAGLGLQGLVLPDAAGGSGAGPVELAVVLEEMGRVVFGGPYLATVLAGLLLLELDSPAARDLMPGLAAGDTVATVALGETDADGDPSRLGVTARRTGGAWRLDGTARWVLSGHVADVVLVAARTPDGTGVFAVASGAAGLATAARTTFDPTRALATVTLADTPATSLGTPGEDGPAVERALVRGAVALAAEQVGGAQRTLDMTVDYAKLRVQFGRAIGSFQAVKHLCADMLLEVESARSAAYYASHSAAEGAADLPAVASLAKAYCSDAYVGVAATTIQVHGGIGFTWEHPGHLHLRRARGSALLLGSAEEHRERYARSLGLDPVGGSTR